MKKTYVMINGELILKNDKGELVQSDPHKYGYVFSDGHNETMTEKDALEYCKKNQCEILISEYIEMIKSQRLIRCNSHSRGDSWKPGFHPGLGKVVTSYRDYQRELKEKNLIEVGNESMTPEVNKKIKTISEETIKEAVEMGAEISGNEAQALIDGTYENPMVDAALKESIEQDKLSSL
jgi:hypothetical protein